MHGRGAGQECKAGVHGGGAWQGCMPPHLVKLGSHMHFQELPLGTLIPLQMPFVGLEAEAPWWWPCLVHLACFYCTGPYLYIDTFLSETQLIVHMAADWLFVCAFC